MSELNYTQQGSQPQPEDAAEQGTSPKAALVRAMRVIDRAIPNYRTPDAMAYALARRTPAVLVIAFALLFAGIIGSRLGLWMDGSLWGIPSLGAISIALGLWLWSSNVTLHPNLSQDARETLRRAMKLQIAAIALSGLSLVYFLGMAIGGW